MFVYNGNIDDFLENSPLGARDKALSNLLYGLRHSRTMAPVPLSKDAYGFTFFTRPQLNLRSSNIRNIRQFYPLLTEKILSIQRYVRVMLDPRLPYRLRVNGKEDYYYSTEIIDTPLVDKYNPFITVLTNSIKSMSGWPDMVVPEWTSNSGIRKEQISMIDGTWEIYDVFDIDVTYDNHVGDPILMLHQVWIMYASLVFEGMIAPYWDMPLENEIDYNTRIYRLVMDPTWRRVKRIAATGAAYPINVPTGKFFDYSTDKPYTEQTKEINIRYKCMGAMYNDDILIKEFNETNAIFNPAYREYLRGNKDAMSEIPRELLEFFNFRGYPYIDPNTYELKWLIPKTSPTYMRIEEAVKNKITDKKLEEAKKINDFVNTNMGVENTLLS
jgi:hypothetical protein